MKERLRIRLINRLKVRTTFTSSSAPSLSKENQQADFINCVEFGKLAEFAEKYLKKGLKILVSGRIQTGSYVNQEGNKVYATNVIVEEHYFAEGKKLTGAEKKEDTDPDGFMHLPDGEELPFE